MLTLHTFGPAFGLPDPSPFCLKAMTLLKMSGLDHRIKPSDVRKAPKGKMPYLVDGDSVVPDTTFIRWYLEQTYGVDYETGLSDTAKANAWAFEKLCEDNLYWLVLYDRWAVDENFNNGPRQFFDPVPAPLRPLITTMVRRQIKRDLHGQGCARHSDEERLRLFEAGLRSLAVTLADKPYFMGETPSAIDATVFAFTAQAGCRHFDTPMRAAFDRHPNLAAYADRLMQQWFPEYTTDRH